MEIKIRFRSRDYKKVLIAGSIPSYLYIIRIDCIYTINGKSVSVQFRFQGTYRKRKEPGVILYQCFDGIIPGLPLS